MPLLSFKSIEVAEMNPFNGLPSSTCLQLLRDLGATVTPYSSLVSPSASQVPCGCFVVDLHRPKENKAQIAALYSEIAQIVSVLSETNHITTFWVFTSVNPEFSDVLLTGPYSCQPMPFESFDPEDVGELFSEKSDNHVIARFKNSKMEPLCLCLLNTCDPQAARAIMSTFIDIEINTGEVGSFCERYKKAAHWVFSTLSGVTFTATTYGKSVEESPLGVGTTKAARVALKTATYSAVGLRWLKWPAFILLFVFIKSAILISMKH